MKLKAGIIGCGGIANGKHLPALKKASERVEITAFCDIIEERAIEACKKYGTDNSKVYTDYKELLKDESIDTIHVCTPNRSHSEISIAAMKAGKNVICEKPMAKTYAEAKEMLDCAKKTKKILTIGYQNRYKRDSLYIKKCCENGELGDIYYAKATALRRRGVPTWGVFLNEYEQGGGPLIDIGTHALDLTLWCMNNYDVDYVAGSAYYKFANQHNTANAFGEWKDGEFTVEDSAFGFIRMKNGATVILESSWALNTLDIGEAKTALCGTKAGVDMNDGLRINGVKHGIQYIERPQIDGKGVEFFDAKRFPDQCDLELSAFLDAVEGKAELSTKPEQAAVVTRILEAIYTSAKTGKPVFFD